jgi:hypothetical protein
MESYRGLEKAHFLLWINEAQYLGVFQFRFHTKNPKKKGGLFVVKPFVERGWLCSQKGKVVGRKRVHTLSNAFLQVFFVAKTNSPSYKPRASIYATDSTKHTKTENVFQTLEVENSASLKTKTYT